MKEDLIKALTKKITELTGLVSKYDTNKVEPNTPHFSLAYKGLKVKSRRGPKVKRGLLKFDLIYQAQMNVEGDMINYADHEDDLLPLFDYTLPDPVTNKNYIELADVGGYTKIRLYPTWNEEDVSQEINSFTEDFNMAKRIFKLELEYRT